MTYILIFYQKYQNNNKRIVKYLLAKLKGELKQFLREAFDKILHFTKKFLLKNPFFMVFGNFIFADSNGIRTHNHNQFG